MKIIHVCFEAPYIDNWGYQENLIPKYNEKMGNDVVVIASKDVLPKYLDNKYEYLKKPREYSIDGVKIIRIKSSINILNRIVWYKDLSEIISFEKPDIIYLHCGQSLSLISLVKYKIRSKCKLIVDFHSDYGNSGNGKISKFFLHKLIWRKVIGYSEKYIDNIFCITPWVKEFVKDMYNIKDEKIQMTYLGTDDEKVNFNDKEEIRKNIRGKLNIGIRDKVIISGGKINKSKNIDILINSVNSIKNNNIHLIIFGSIDKPYSEELESLISNSEQVHYVGWLSAEETYNYYLSSDLAVFPGTQSVLWQQAIYCGLPLIIKKWPYGDYLNEGNVIFLDSDSIDELVSKISYIINDGNELDEMSKISIECGQKKFSYKNIAEKIFE